ncbi:MAG: hypothetical protein ABFE07_28240 [Armatimonadia bacterium]
MEYPPICRNCKHFRWIIVGDGGRCLLDGQDVLPGEGCHITAFEGAPRP